MVEAWVYIGNIHNLRRVFGDHINVNIISRVEQFIEKKIGDRVELIYQAEEEGESSEKSIEIQAKKELLGAEVKELLNMAFEEQYVSTYDIDTELKFHGIPELPNLKDIPPKIYYHYVAFSYHVMILNQLEEHISRHFGTLTYYPFPLYEKTLSLLTALKFLNSRLYELLLYREEFLNKKEFENLTYLDLAKKAVITAREFFLSHQEEIKLLATEIRRNLNAGALSLGIEMEFSNLGYRTLRENVSWNKDRTFAGFQYFKEFDLLRRLWKLGGHLDDHRLSEQEDKQGGFLEFAVGRESIFSTKSSPLTKSLFISHEFLRELIMFTNIRPHSLHINIQNPHPVNWNKENNTELLKCLILLAGDFRKNKKGKIIEKRIYNKEIVRDPNGYLRFICENRHQHDENNVFSVMEYQFSRLSMTKDYEALIGAFKGFQVGYNPRPFGSKSSIIKQRVIREESRELEKWAGDVQPVSQTTIESFLSYVSQGLFTEKHGHPAHKKKYIEDLMFRIEKELKSVNESISYPLTFMRRDQEIPYEKMARKFLIS
jgi:hypothetical protein